MNNNDNHLININNFQFHYALDYHLIKLMHRVTSHIGIWKFKFQMIILTKTAKYLHSWELYHVTCSFLSVSLATFL